MSESQNGRPNAFVNITTQGIQRITMQNNPYAAPQTASIESSVEVNKVLRNTYMLLSMTLAFSAVTASIAMAMNLGHGMSLVFTLISFGLLFVVHKTADSSKGIIAIFAFTGLLGASIGPLLNHYLSLPGGSMIVMQSLGMTAVAFISLSAYAISSKKDFSYMGGFLLVGLIVAIVASIANIFLAIPVLSLVISGAVVMIMCGFILFDTSRIINGGETNYIRATVSLYLNIYNLFISLLHITGALSGDD